MSEKSEKAKELFKSGCNCSQSVLCVFCEELGLDFETAMKISSSFGGGMGRMREVCGTVSGMFMAAGLAYNSKDNKKASVKNR
ncbi:C_GCAxxG_C_C family protein [bacterium]|nr:C_GCAxxG_C_C family protein [bacterium]